MSKEGEGASLRDRAAQSNPQAVSSKASIPSAEQLHILRHSLGINHGDEMYRNHFCTNEATVDWPHCTALVEMGLMTRQKGGTLTGGDDVFFVTDEGKQVALDSKLKLTLAQKRYRQWLNVADVFDISFGDWLKAQGKD